MRGVLTLALLASVCSAAAGLEVVFDDSNELKGVRVGEATFATGGGDLWTAEFSAGANREERVKLRPSQASSRARQETDEEIVLSWKGLPLGDERDAVDAVVTIGKRKVVLLAANLTDRSQRLRCRAYGSESLLNLELQPFALVDKDLGCP